MTTDLDPPFGTFALPAPKEAWRARADSYGDNRWGRWMISLCRGRAMSGESEPFDVGLTDGPKARLYPKTNRCEKRAFAGVQVWDAAERSALRTAIKTSSEKPFVFFDVGANVGLYSLFAAHYAAAANRPAQIFAIEPSLEICARLEANWAANDFGPDIKLEIIRAAISDTPGKGRMERNHQNRGEAHLGPVSGSGEAVIIDTLARICRMRGVAHIDAMKVDIEGHDLLALQGFFQDSTERLYPDLLIVETGHESDPPVLELCRAQGYGAVQRVGLNAILKRHTNV